MYPADDIQTAQVSCNLSRVDVTSNPDLTEEFKRLPFRWGPVSPEWKERLIQSFVARRKVFSMGEWDFGETKQVEHEIKLNDERPFRERSRRLALSDLNDLRAHLHQLLDIKIIQESRSQYASPIVIVRKKNGDIRLCVDYRKLNARTLPDQYAVPLVQEGFAGFYRRFVSGYSQIAYPLHRLTAGVTVHGRRAQI
ncbi:hypothetical protein BSL78_26694 [Apostichopus japonicus]|uniref:Reverse transcriptase n=1 Tax=Stichopus japonicus TaxID=307972 RepID=A0A2G8JL38_STIJA|nr:hypothetical protein BSL78_26694 [Apostichopus japonicus]